MVPSIIVGVIVACILGFALYTLFGNKKKGRSSCGCGCSGCKLACSSRKPEEAEKAEKTEETEVTEEKE